MTKKEKINRARMYVGHEINMIRQKGEERKNKNRIKAERDIMEIEHKCRIKIMSINRKLRMQINDWTIWEFEVERHK